MGTNLRKILTPAYLVTFVALAWYFLYVRNADTMYFLADRGWWNDTLLFWRDCTSVPGGLLAWAGSYLTQYFFYPALGCALLIVVWAVTFLLAKWQFRVPDEWSFLLFLPLAALLCSDIQLGYWVYILTDIDYVFYHPLGLLASLLLSIPFWRYLPIGEKARRWMATLWIPLVAAVFYYPLGIYALLAAVLSAVQSLALAHKEGRRALISHFLILSFSAAVTLWLVPLLETAGSTLMRPDQPWLYGFRRFELDSLRDYSLELPFYLVLVLPLFFPFIKEIRTRSLPVSQTTMLLVAVLTCLFLSRRDFTDYNFHAEMRMQKAVEECRWNDVLSEAARAKGPVTREMVMFRDIALINRGELCSRHYTFNNESIPPTVVSDSIHLRIADQAADLIYYNFGETIFAIRRAIERCMNYGYSHYTLRMLARCAIVNGESENARKYLRLLQHTSFWGHWADEMLPYAADARLLPQSDLFRTPLRLYNEGSELVGVDDKYVELTILNKWMYTVTDDPVAQEVALGCAMLMRDRNCFWTQVQRYYNLHGGESFPTHVQEAMLLDVYELGMKGVNLSFVHFDQRVLDRYQAFISRMRQYASQGMDEKTLGSALRPEFGNTYMWDYCVLREVQTN